MLMVIDIGNTRTKWAQVTSDGALTDYGMTPNFTLAQSTLQHRLLSADKVIVANVAGDAIAEVLSGLVPLETSLHFVSASVEACRLVNQYEQSEALGVDRWASAIAAWHKYQQPTVIVNAGTAITIDSLSMDATLGTTGVKSSVVKTGCYLGGTIMPGLYLMHDALVNHTAKLANATTGTIQAFPVNTVDAMQTGCMRAIVGAIVLASQQLEKYGDSSPIIVITGGDAVKIADMLKGHLKKVAIDDHLVLQGLALLQKAYV